MPDDVSPDMDSRTVDDLITKMLSGQAPVKGIAPSSVGASSLFRHGQGPNKVDIPPLAEDHISPRIPLYFDPKGSKGVK